MAKLLVRLILEAYKLGSQIANCRLSGMCCHLPDSGLPAVAIGINAFQDPVPHSNNYPSMGVKGC